MVAKQSWEPSSVIPRDEIVRLHNEVVRMPTVQTRTREDIFRIQALEMDWDIGVVVYEPLDFEKVPSGPDGKRIGVLLIHGGVSDYKSVECVARPLAEKFAIKVVSMTFPGRFYLLDPSRDWPGDVENPDGSARTPLWTKETRITKDQYEVVRDVSKRENYGTIVSLAAKEGTKFFYRMAAWPAAFEAAIKEEPHGAISRRINSRFTFTATLPAAHSR